MTLAEARANIGRLVVYRPFPDVYEEGIIHSVGDYFVFVRYGSQQTPAATRAEDLRFTAGSAS